MAAPKSRAQLPHLTYPKMNVTRTINAHRSAAAADFVPTEVAGLEFWIDAGDTSTLFTDTSGTTGVASDGDAIARIEDLSGNGYHVTQGSAVYQPQYKESIQNGRSVARFSSDHLTSGSNFSITGSSARTIFVVASKDVATNSIYVSWGTAGNAQDAYSVTQEYGVRISGGNKLFAVAGSTSVFTVATFLQSTSTLAGLTFFHNGSSESSTSSGGTTSTLNTSATSIVVGGWVPSSPTTNPADADIAEILIYDSALGTSDREAVETYLGGKWAISITH